MTPDASPPGMNGGSGLNWYLPYDSNTSGKWSIHVAPLDGTPGASSDWPPLDSGRGTRPAQFAGEWTGGVRNFSGAGQSSRCCTERCARAGGVGRGGSSRRLSKAGARGGSPVPDLRRRPSRLHSGEMRQLLRVFGDCVFVQEPRVVPLMRRAEGARGLCLPTWTTCCPRWPSDSGRCRCRRSCGGWW